MYIYIYTVYKIYLLLYTQLSTPGQQKRLNYMTFHSIENGTEKVAPPDPAFPSFHPSPQTKNCLLDLLGKVFPTFSRPSTGNLTQLEEKLLPWKMKVVGAQAGVRSPTKCDVEEMLGALREVLENPPASLSVYFSVRRCVIL